MSRITTYMSRIALGNATRDMSVLVAMLIIGYLITHLHESTYISCSKRVASATSHGQIVTDPYAL